jgi:hypothetical protein
VWRGGQHGNSVLSQRGHARKAMHRGMHECARARVPRAACVRVVWLPLRSGGALARRA